jgi:hypothetical protein
MGVNSDLMNPRPFKLGGNPIAGNDQSRIRQMANNAKAKGQQTISTFKKLTATGGTQAGYPEVSNQPANVPPNLMQQVSAADAGERLRTHSNLIDNLIDQFMFG